MDTGKKTNLFYTLVFFLVMVPGLVVTSVALLGGIHWFFKYLR